ncbi:hypothetical protein A3860_13660 [Niastella vici]|uniref:Uncharacterized protein n=1 Tax=Niastella vici TaxID=1703345 RepID=A0A1V9G7S2_9BACT|nr:hypothetical protein [Niastella vici]OQP66526.1 hypothetical protein A3860_13660 [Niastella vici]
MIVALAGRRIDAAGAEVVRFPSGTIEKVKEELKALLGALQPQVLVTSGACGADLLALEAAGELNIPRSMVLPFDPLLFRSTSVTDRPGNWGALYDQIGEAVKKEKGIQVMHYDETDNDTYLNTNKDILKRAKELALEFHSNDLVAIIVWEGQPKKEDDTTANFKREAERNGFGIKEIITR